MAMLQTPLHPMTLVTIVAESTIEHRLTTDLRALGANGFTVVEGRGEGTRHLHASELPGDNVRVETVVPRETAERILAHLADRYFHDYSIIAYLTDVAVLRSEKYAAGQRAHPRPGAARAER
jgi:nitrogen regulatory protein P-II 2